MSRAPFFVRYALIGLRRGGQRVVIALLAVAFGVMSLIAMSSVAATIDSTLNQDVVIQVGGDLSLTRPGERFDTSALHMLETLQTEGLIQQYSPVSETFTLLMRTEQSGKAQFVFAAIGVDPQVYPLVGRLDIAAPSDALPADVLRETGTALITRDLAARYDLTIGDTLRLAYPEGVTLPLPLTIAGIVEDTPDHIGGRIYYSLATAQSLHGDEAAFNYVVVRSDQEQEAAARLESAGWEVERAATASNTAGEAAAFFNFMLRGSGILGLMVGGIGIANTMQVLLTLRRKEVGLLKVLGYSRRDLLVMFMLEAGLLGLFGSLLGALLAVLISGGLTALFAHISTLLITWQFNPLMVMGGILAGVATTLLFALYAILQTSNVRPTVIFRQEVAARLGWRDWLKGLGVYALLGLPFAGMTSLLLGSVVQGIGILALALVGFIVLGVGLGVTLWLVVRGLPAFRFTLLRMARNTLRKRSFSTLFGMIALFIGIFALGFAATVIQSSLDQFAQRQDNSHDYNLLIYADMASVGQIETLLAEYDTTAIERRYPFPVQALEADGFSETELQIRDTAWDIRILEGAAFGTEQGMYVRTDSPLSIGAEVRIHLQDGSRHTVPIIGRYEPTQDSLIVFPAQTPILSRDTLHGLGLETTGVNLYARIDPAQEEEVAERIGAQLPATLLLTRQDVIAEINRTFNNLFGIAVGISGLGLLAGMMLVANTVSLGMVQRRFDIGVMKAVGYTQRQVFMTLALEYGLIGGVTSLAALVAVQVSVIVIAATQAGAAGVLWIHPLTALFILMTGLILTVGTALLAAWQPARTRPLTVLNAGAG